MKFRKKISFSIIVFNILLESLVRSFPHTFSDNPYINEDSWNVIQDPIYETLYLQGNNKSPIQCKSRLRCFPNNNYIKGIDDNSGEEVDNEFIIPPEFSSAANYRDLCNFPEVEYPLSAREMWKPNYWNSYTNDFLNKNINTDCGNSMLSDHFSKINPMQNFETKYKPGRLATKSLSDSRKNLATLKTKGLNNFKNDSSHDNATRNLSNNTNVIPLDNSKLCNFYTTVLPFIPYSEKNMSSSEVNPNVCLKDKSVLEHRNSLNVDDTSYLTPQPEVLLEYSETFKKEIEAILKKMADNIISKNIESNSNTSFRKEVVDDDWELNLTLINNITDKFDKEMTSKIKSVADTFMNNIDSTENSWQNSENVKNPLKPDILSTAEASITQTPNHADVCTGTKMNDFRIDTKEATCKKIDIVKNNTCQFNGLSSRTVSENDVTCKKETLDFCKSEANIINEMNNEDEIFVPARDADTQNIMQSVSGNSDQEISLEEEFTTDSYPENNEWSYALSTVAPQPSNVDIMWRDTNVIEPDKSLAYPDELEQYFILTSD